MLGMQGARYFGFPQKPETTTKYKKVKILKIKKINKKFIFENRLFNKENFYNIN